MGPKKKSKRPAANPARGFATTSTVSKSKAIDNDTVDPLEEAQAGVPEPAINPQDGSNRPPEASAEPQIADLTPEQLEARLEEADLQHLVDANRERCQKDVARCVSKLKTERRLLRGAAERLDIRKWLPDDLRRSMMDLLIKGNSEGGEDIARDAVGKIFDVSEDWLVIRAWALKKALRDLDFTEEKSNTAILNLLGNTQSFVNAQTRSVKESLWGLDECIEWLSLHCDRDELPGYETHATPVNQRLHDIQIQELQAKAERLALEQAALKKKKNTELKESISRQGYNTLNGMASEDERHSSDSDIEPLRQLEKYLDFKTRLHKRRPDLTEVNLNNKGKKAKGARTASPKAMDSKSSKLLRRIKTLERDLLFDTEEATQRWTELRIRLVAEEAERRHADKLKVAEEEPQKETSSAVNDAKPDDDASIGFGEFFASLPELSSDIEGSNGTTTTVTDNDIKVLIRDFGVVSGMSPRRVIEEVCRARDTGAKVSFTTVSGSSFFWRHEISIKWSKDHDLPPEVQLEGIENMILPRQISAKMVAVGCPDKTQSESYISVVALFLAFSSSAKEEKAYLRLPAAWRNLYSDCIALKKEQNDAADREELRSIRETVQKAYRGPTNAAPLQYTNEPSQTEGNKRHGGENVGQKLAAPTDPAMLAQDWSVRATSSSFQAMLPQRKSLPIWSHKEYLMDVISEHQAVILCGETGCGKSTQLPSYLLEESLSQGKPCKIYCTQPRRISALSLARRVSEELGERKGDVGTARSLVGYAIRLESQVTAQTRLVYATTGIVMRMLERGNELEGITHVVLDEVHERNIDSDFLLIVLRRLMEKRPELKVILMSATVDANQFASYLGGVPVVNIPGRTFPVETKFLEDAIEECGYGGVKSLSKRDEILDEEDDAVEDPKRSVNLDDLSSYNISTRNTLKQFNEYRIDYELTLKLLETIAQKPKFAQYSKAILVFLPGMGEIRRLNDMIIGHGSFGKGWIIIPLHSTISTEDQEMAFVVPPRGIRKIVLATNIAETGITIPDVTCVIDTGKHKEMRFDERRQLSRLIEAFISRANAKQRRGRAGRVQDGLCFHLFTKQRHDQMMPDAQTPEMLRLSLQDLALRVKICKLGEIEQVLSEALSPPLAKNVRRAVDSLIEVRALTAEQQLTILGRRLASLPVDVYLGKLILLSSVFRCLDAGLTIAAILSAKSPFTVPVSARSQADQARLAFKRGNSDLLTAYNAYCAWRRTSQNISTSEQHFCRKNFLSIQTLSSIEDLKAQLATALAESGFLNLDEAARASLNRVRYSSRQRHFLELPESLDANSNNDSILNSVISWSFYPKLLIRDGNGYRNVANNQNVSIYPASVNKTTKPSPQLLSYYHIMQASSRAYHAHETNAVEGLAVALACGEGEFKPYSGMLVIDGNRLRFSVSDWQSMLLLRGMRQSIREIMSSKMRDPRKELSEWHKGWYNGWEEVFMEG